MNRFLLVSGLILVFNCQIKETSNKILIGDSIEIVNKSNGCYEGLKRVKINDSNYIKKIEIQINISKPESKNLNVNDNKGYLDVFLVRNEKRIPLYDIVFSRTTGYSIGYKGNRFKNDSLLWLTMDPLKINSDLVLDEEPVRRKIQPR